MVLDEGNSEIGSYMWSYLGYCICFAFVKIESNNKSETFVSGNNYFPLNVSNMFWVTILYKYNVSKVVYLHKYGMIQFDVHI